MTLFDITLSVDLIAMAITLWMAFYLFARGFPSKLTFRAVILLLALAVFFFSAYTNMFHLIPRTAALRAGMLIIGLGTWYSLTYHLGEDHPRSILNWKSLGLYIWGGLTLIVLALNQDSFIVERENILYVARMGIGPPFLMHGLFQVAACGGILHNLLRENQIGLTSQGRFFLIASIFPTIGVVYGVLALALLPPMPRLLQDVLVFGGVFLMGISVVRHQSLIERRTSFQDFPLTSFAILIIALVYLWFSHRINFAEEWTAHLVVLVITTHGLYDFVREFLERQRFQKESAFRKQWRNLENEGMAENAVRIPLQEGLELLCQTLNASSGIIALREGDEFLVAASISSMPLEYRLPIEWVACEDISQPNEKHLPFLSWIAPSFEGRTQIAVVGIGKSKTRVQYTGGDLDLLAEVADQVGTIVSLNRGRRQEKEQIRQFVAESETKATELMSVAEEVIGTIETTPDPNFIKTVEESLRNLSDFIKLGQSSLAEQLGVEGKYHTDRGRHLQHLLMEAINSLKPAEKRPSDPLPRVWYNYVVLYDAYVEGVPNREIMARLYISEGTFNRTRRNALRGLARLLAEKTKP
ncbi:MAG: hypothetical protein HUU38_19600 [Anaerolineales bacterium]|nr:hypothetical protein [Anaerolineales bacterium]